MDTRQLNTIMAIVAHGTFARAADVVGLTPSAVSQQVQALEQELGVRIFERASRPPNPTSAGMQVFEMAKEILRIVDNTKASLSGDRISGTLMIGSVRSSALNLLPKAIVQMRRAYPDLKVNLRISLSSTLIADVASGRLDAAIVAEHVNFPPSIRWSTFLKEPLWIIGAPGTDLSDPQRALKTLPFIRFRSAVPLANLIDTELSRLGVTVNDVAEIDTIGSIVTCVEQGLGISVVPHAALNQSPEAGLAQAPFGEPQLTRHMGMVERTVSPRADIIARLHDMLAKLSGIHGAQRVGDNPVGGRPRSEAR